jgi:hypothetical protein
MKIKEPVCPAEDTVRSEMMLCRALDFSAPPTVLSDDGRNRTDKRAFKRNILGAEEGKINDH